MQTKKIKHSREYLLRCFDFDFETGDIYFKSRSDIQNFNSHCGFNQWKNRVGKKAFNTPHKDNYLRGKFENIKYYAHRLIFYVYHDLQPQFIDHRDRNPQNNSIDNLRAATMTQNILNREVTNISQTPCGKYLARTTLNGQRIYLGGYNTQEQALEIIAKFRNENNANKVTYL